MVAVGVFWINLRTIIEIRNSKNLVTSHLGHDEIRSAHRWQSNKTNSDISKFSSQNVSSGKYKFHLYEILYEVSWIILTLDNSQKVSHKAYSAKLGNILTKEFAEQKCMNQTEWKDRVSGGKFEERKSDDLCKSQQFCIIPVCHICCAILH